MKKILLFTCILVAGLCITSCSKDDGVNGNISKNLEGLWVETEYYDEEYKYEGIVDCRNSVGQLYEFFSDNSICIYDYEVENGIFSNGFIYEISKNDIERYNNLGRLKYQIENNVLWVAGIQMGKITFINDNKFKLEDIIEGYYYYSIFERVKGFK